MNSKFILTDKHITIPDSGKIIEVDLPKVGKVPLKLFVRPLVKNIIGELLFGCSILKNNGPGIVTTGGWTGLHLSGDAIITIHNMGYDLTDKQQLKKAKKNRTQIFQEYERLLENKPELFGIINAGNEKNLKEENRKETESIKGKERKRVESGKVDSLDEARYRDLVIEYLERGEKINAIKVYKTNKNSSLNEATEYVDSLQKALQEGAWKESYEEKMRKNSVRKRKQKEKRIKSLMDSIIQLLKDNPIKMPTSDINAHLKHKNLDEIKDLCQQLYENGKINFAGNSRYYIVSNEKKKSKKTLPPKSEEVDMEKELKKIKSLLDKGLIEQEDYDAKKKKILGL